jgi:hypothetical protein
VRTTNFVIKRIGSLVAALDEMVHENIGQHSPFIFFEDIDDKGILLPSLGHRVHGVSESQVAAGVGGVRCRHAAAEIFVIGEEWDRLAAQHFLDAVFAGASTMAGLNIFSSTVARAPQPISQTAPPLSGMPDSFVSVVCLDHCDG